MKYDLDVPFYSNAPDGTHCFQAGLKMVLKYLFPECEYSFEQLDVISAKKEGMWTWQMAGLLWLQEQGVEVKDIEPFDFARFIEEGGEYLVDEFGEEMGRAQIEHSDIEQERGLSREFIKRVDVEKRVPSMEDIKELIRDGYVVCCNVNSAKLDGKEGYCGHFVVAKGFDETGFIVHDPGLPPMENMTISFEVFEMVWAYPNEQAKNIMAFRKK